MGSGCIKPKIDQSSISKPKLSERSDASTNYTSLPMNKTTTTIHKVSAKITPEEFKLGLSKSPDASPEEFKPSLTKSPDANPEEFKPGLNKSLDASPNRTTLPATTKISTIHNFSKITPEEFNNHLINSKKEVKGLIVYLDDKEGYEPNNVIISLVNELYTFNSEKLSLLVLDIAENNFIYHDISLHEEYELPFVMVYSNGKLLGYSSEDNEKKVEDLITEAAGGNLKQAKLNLPTVNTNITYSLAAYQVRIQKKIHESLVFQASSEGKAFVFIFGTLCDQKEQMIMNLLNDHPKEINFIKLHYEEKVLEIALMDIENDRDLQVPIVKVYYDNEFVGSSFGQETKRTYNIITQAIERSHKDKNENKDRQI